MLLLSELTEEIEPVRREQLPQLGVAEQMLVGGVPDGLELVQQSGLGRIVGRELVDDEHAASRSCHPGELRDDEIGPRDVMERAVRASEIEVTGGKRQRCPVSVDELGVRRRALAGELEELGHRVKPDDLSHERRKGDGQSTGAGADIEGTLVAGRPDDVAHLFRELRRSEVLPRRDTLRRAREAVTH